MKLVETNERTEDERTQPLLELTPQGGQLKTAGGLTTVPGFLGARIDHAQNLIQSLITISIRLSQYHSYFKDNKESDFIFVYLLHCFRNPYDLLIRSAWL